MILYRIFSLLCWLMITAGANAQAVTGGFREAVIVVEDRVRWEHILTDVGGWQITTRGAVDDRWLALWGVDDSARFTLMANPGTTRGFIRLIEFSQKGAPLIRPNDQAWDTGGLFDLNMRVKDMEAARQALMQRGWSASSDPVTFSFGPFTVAEWIPRGPDGVRLALIERLAPKLEGWPSLRKFSRTFNSTMVVKDVDQARVFWEDVLGFKLYLEHRGASKEAGPNVLGLPHNVATNVERDVLILHPEGRNEGSIELLAFGRATGRDFSERTAMPNRGLSRLRFPVEGLAGLAAKVKEAGIKVVARGADLPLSGVGIVNVLVLAAPGGAQIELYEKQGG